MTPGAGGLHVDGDLVGLEHRDGLVDGDGVTHLLVELPDDRFGDRLAQLRNLDLDG